MYDENEYLLEEDFEVEDTNFNLGNIFINRRPFKLSIRSQVPIPNIIKDPLLYHPTIVNELQELTLRYCDIEVIPPEISKLVNLRVLNLSRNKIKIIPTEVYKLINKKLDTLIIYKNEISDLNIVPSGSWPTARDHNAFQGLKELNVSFNKLKKLPKWIWRCTDLTHLDIIYNNIEEFSNNLKALPFLKTFYWYGNKGEYLDYGHTGTLEYNKVNNYVKSKLYPSVDFTTMAKLNQIHYHLGFISMETETPIFVNKKFKHYDVFEMEEIETTIARYCNKKPGENIVILYKNAGDEKYQHFLTDRETFKRQYNNSSSVVHPCKIADTLNPDNILLDNDPLFNIKSIGLVNSFKYILIPQKIYEHLIEKKMEDVANIFVIDGTGVKFPSFVSKAVRNGGTYVGAMHCQAGHEERVGVIRFVREKSLRKKKFLPEVKKPPPAPKPPRKGSSGSSSGSSSSSRPSKKRKRGGKRRKSRKRKKNRKKNKKTRKKKKKKR
jgi:hypothetical protein